MNTIESKGERYDIVRKGRDGHVYRIIIDIYIYILYRCILPRDLEKGICLLKAE